LSPSDLAPPAAGLLVTHLLLLLVTLLLLLLVTRLLLLLVTHLLLLRQDFAPACLPCRCWNPRFLAHPAVASPQCSSFIKQEGGKLVSGRGPEVEGRKLGDSGELACV